MITPNDGTPGHGGNPHLTRHRRAAAQALDIAIMYCENNTVRDHHRESVCGLCRTVVVGVNPMQNSTGKLVSHQVVL